MASEWGLNFSTRVPSWPVFLCPVLSVPTVCGSPAVPAFQDKGRDTAPCCVSPTGFLEVCGPFEKYTHAIQILFPFESSGKGEVAPCLGHQYLPIGGEVGGSGGSLWGGAWAE